MMPLVAAVTQQTASILLEYCQSDIWQDDIDSQRQFMVYGSTFAFMTLGIYTDLIARGRNLYTLLAAFILF